MVLLRCYPPRVDLLTLLMTIALEANAFGSPVPFPAPERATGIVVALSNGKVQLVSVQGKVLADMALDFDVTAQPVLVDVNGDGTPEIVAADVAGSIYAFDTRGETAVEARAEWEGERLPVLVGGGESDLPGGFARARGVCGPGGESAATSECDDLSRVVARDRGL
jgi:hypothetical protein